MRKIFPFWIENHPKKLHHHLKARLKDGVNDDDDRQNHFIEREEFC
jgi:hypothetical protein